MAEWKQGYSVLNKRNSSPYINIAKEEERKKKEILRRSSITSKGAVVGGRDMGRDVLVFDEVVTLSFEADNVPPREGHYFLRIEHVEASRSLFMGNTEHISAAAVGNNKTLKLRFLQDIPVVFMFSSLSYIKASLILVESNAVYPPFPDKEPVAVAAPTTSLLGNSEQGQNNTNSETNNADDSSRRPSVNSTHRLSSNSFHAESHMVRLADTLVLSQGFTIMGSSMIALNQLIAHKGTVCKAKLYKPAGSSKKDEHKKSTDGDHGLALPGSVSSSVLGGDSNLDFEGVSIGMLVQDKDVENKKLIYVIQARGVWLSKKDVFGLSDPYFRIVLKYTDGKEEPIYQSNVHYHTLNPVWKPIFVEQKNFLDKNKEELLFKFSVYDRDVLLADDIIGHTESLLLSHLVKDATAGIFKKLPLNSNSAENHRNYIEVTSHIAPSFLDVLSNTPIDIAIAIDFTINNVTKGGKDGKEMLNLHSANNKQNKYRKAMSYLLEVLEPFVKNPMTMWSYGAGKAPAKVETLEDPRAKKPMRYKGKHDVLAAYDRTRPEFFTRFRRMGGPTHFSHTIQTITKPYVESSTTSHLLLIMLVGSDVASSDFHDTKKAIIAASHKPVEILFVKVGGFTASSGETISPSYKFLDTLDSDFKLLSVGTGGCFACFGGHEVAARDIVQVVEFEENIADFDRKALEEFPSSMMSYKITKGTRKVGPSAPKKDIKDKKKG